MKNAPVVIGVQEKFISKNIKHLPEKISQFIEAHKFDFVLFTQFLNNKNSNWVKILKWNEMLTLREAKISSELQKFLTRKNVFVKETKFSVFGVDKFRLFIQKNKIKKIFICGMDTHACVFLSAMDAFSNGFEVKIIEDLCVASHGKKFHNMAIKLLKSNLGKETVVRSKNIK